MSMWVAVILACLGPDITSCQPLVKKSIFYDSVDCQEDVQSMLNTLRGQGIYAVGSCIAVEGGASA